jgi:hypothetical protein
MDSLHPRKMERVVFKYFQQVLDENEKVLKGT